MCLPLCRHPFCLHTCGVHLCRAITGGLGWTVTLAVITIGIWFTAVYTSHHYIIDVICGIGCALLGFIVFEYGLMSIPAIRRFMSRYTDYITPSAK